MSAAAVVRSICFAPVITRSIGPADVAKLTCAGAGRWIGATASMDRIDKADGMLSGCCGLCAMCIGSLGATSPAGDSSPNGGHGNGGLRLVNSVTAATSAGRFDTALALVASRGGAFFLPRLFNEMDGCGGGGV